jgi:Aldo/keto reductase family
LVCPRQRRVKPQFGQDETTARSDQKGSNIIKYEGSTYEGRKHEKKSIIEPQMRTKRLGNSNLSITPVGFDAWAIGGSGWEFGWGEQDDKASVAGIHRALELGVNWIDTAAVYGMGHSEEVVAAAELYLTDEEVAEIEGRNVQEPELATAA